MSFRELKQRFKNLSLKKKLLTFYSVLFVLPLLLISVIIYVEMSDSMMEKVRYSARQSYEQAKSYLEYKILWMIQRSDVVITSSNLTDMIREEHAVSLDKFRQMTEKEKITGFLQSVEGNSSGIHMRIYVSDRFVIASERTARANRIFQISQADQAKWYQKKMDRKVYFAPGIYLEEAYRDKKIALVRDVTDPDQYQSRLGVLRMDIDISELEDILRNATPTENAVTYLINQENLIVTASDYGKLTAAGLNGQLPEEFTYSRYADSPELTEKELSGSAVLCMRDKIRNTDWEMITIIPQKDLTGGIARLQTMVAGLMLLFGLLTIIGGMVIVSWLVRRISLLLNSFNQVKQGDLKVHLDSGCLDEIGVLYENYNEMMERTSELMDEKYRMGLSLKSAELKALQSQINPHFLYNTLEMVNWLAYSGRTEDIHNAVISLSKYYRLILNKGQDMLSLGEELQHVQYYLRIQSIRFPGKLTFVEDVEESIKNCEVPKIILQPIVENAISHGILEKKSKQGVIRIHGYQESERVICIKIMDDGVGMNEETLSHVMDGTLKTSGSGYGIKNVHARIQLMFGEEYGLSFQSMEMQSMEEKKGEPEGSGTCVTIRIPR